MTPEVEAAVDRDQLVACFTAEDPRLAPEEKETLLRWTKDRDRVVFDTTEAGLGRRLIAHPETDIDRVTVVRDGTARDGVAPHDVHEHDEIVGVRGTLPLGVLKVGLAPRKTGGHAKVVTQRVLEEVTNGDE